MTCLITTFDIRSLWLIPEFVSHYRNYGVKNFILTVHINPEMPISDRVRWLDIAESLMHESKTSLHSVFLSNYNSELLRQFQDEIRREISSKTDWVVWADADEFHEFPCALSELIKKLDFISSPALGGRLVDRLPRFPGKLSTGNIWQRFPLGTNLTEEVLQGWVRKIVLARSVLPTFRGHHFLADEQGNIRDDIDVNYTTPIHHFKWDDTVLERLKERTSEIWKASIPWWTESERAIEWLEVGGYNVEDSNLHITDFEDDLRGLAGPCSVNPRYCGGPYWDVELSRTQYLNNYRKMKIEYQPWLYKGQKAGEQRDIHLVLSKSAGAKIHHSCFVASTAGVFTEHLVMGERSWIGAFAVIRGNVVLGDDCSINTNAHIAGIVTMGNGVRIAAGASLLGFTHDVSDANVTVSKHPATSKGIKIGNDVCIGTNAVILDGISISDGCIIAAGSVVTKSFDKNQIIGGNPAKVLRSRQSKSSAEIKPEGICEV